MDAQVQSKRLSRLWEQRILFVRQPGLLAQSVKKSEDNYPLVVSAGKVIRDVCPFALVRGVFVHQPLVQARRLCPTLRVVPLEGVDARALSHRFLDCLADLSPCVEPDGPDAAYADLSGYSIDCDALEANLHSLTGFGPLIGFASSKLAARACAECELPPERLMDASVSWLWPEDEKVVARLKRLGLVTFGDVSALSEEHLFYQFGKIGRLLHRHALGQDFSPVRALWPPPRAESQLDFSEFPLSDRTMLQAALAQLAHEVAGQLQEAGQVGRLLVLGVQTEQAEQRQEWRPPLPLQAVLDVTRTAQRLLMLLSLTGPILSLSLRVDELETPKAATADLFAGRMFQDTLALEAARRILTDRYGPQALVALSQRPQSLRQKRRAAEQEMWQ